VEVNSIAEVETIGGRDDIPNPRFRSDALYMAYMHIEVEIDVVHVSRGGDSPKYPLEEELGDDQVIISKRIEAY
jgi:hypothetical protein